MVHIPSNTVVLKMTHEYLHFEGNNIYLLKIDPTVGQEKCLKYILTWSLTVNQNYMNTHSTFHCSLLDRWLTRLVLTNVLDEKEDLQVLTVKASWIMINEHQHCRKFIVTLSVQEETTLRYKASKCLDCSCSSGLHTCILLVQGPFVGYKGP